MDIYFSTTRADSTKWDALLGRSSHFYREKDAAQGICDAQNNRAQALGIKARYSIGKCGHEDTRGETIR